MDEQVKIVQLIRGVAESSDYCLDAEGNIYKIEYSGGRNQMTLIKQVIIVIKP